jgi:hypothetical protein
MIVCSTTGWLTYKRRLILSGFSGPSFTTALPFRVVPDAVSTGASWLTVDMPENESDYQRLTSTSQPVVIFRMTLEPNTVQCSVTLMCRIDSCTPMIKKLPVQ